MFTGQSHHQRKFSNVASEHHFLCLLGGGVTTLATVATDGCPTNHRVKFVLKGSFGQCFLFLL